jgi:hypothetical protein
MALGGTLRLAGSFCFQDGKMIMSRKLEIALVAGVGAVPQ